MDQKEIKGIVGEIEPKEGRTRIQIDGYWFTAFKELDVKKDDYVEGTYFEKANPQKPEFPYKNILTLEAKDKPKDYEQKQEERQSKIIKQSCLKAAASAHIINAKLDESESKEIAEQIIKMAKVFEGYINEGKDEG